MDEKSSKLKKFSAVTPLITAFIAVTGVLIPILGFAFLEGYLSVFGISNEIIPSAFNELWIQGHYIILYWLLLILENNHWLTILEPVNNSV